MIHIITRSDIRPDFIYIQHESIKKYVKCDYEYIVLNNSIDNKQNYNEIHKICKELNIKCVDITLDDDLRFLGGQYNFNNQKNRYLNANVASAYSTTWTFQKYITDEKYICNIDADIFFIRDINLEKLISDTEFIYIPQYRAKGKVHYAWNPFFLINLEKNKNLKNLQWINGTVLGDACDVGGPNHFDLIKYKPKHIHIEEYCIYETKKDLNNGNNLIHYTQNGNVNYVLTTDSNYKFLSLKHIGGFKLEKNKTFPHEPDFENHEKYIFEKIIGIIKNFNEKNIEFPKPEIIAFIGFIDNNNHFAVHYKGGSNYMSCYTKDYNAKKTESIKKLI
jgi:hypothetical protein